MLLLRMKKMFVVGFLTIIILIVLLLLINLYLIYPNYLFDKTMTDNVAPSSPMKMNLFISQPPVVGETAEIVAVIKWIPDIKPGMPNTFARIILPEGFELLKGNLEWEGKLQKEANFSVIVKSVKVGNWTIEGIARNPPTGDTFSGGRDFIYILIGEQSSFIQEWPFPEERECPQGQNCTRGEPW